LGVHADRRRAAHAGLLHFHTLGFSPVQLAYLFVLYEIAGVVTNLSAGWIAARFGLTRTLYAGLGFRWWRLLALTQLDPAWAVGTRWPS
jgi:sugar phosphate permease